MLFRSKQKPEGTPSGLTVHAAVGKQTHHQTVADLLSQPEPAPLAANASPKEKMAHRLQTSVGKQLYKLRKQTVEPVFGIIKSVLWLAGSFCCAAGRKCPWNGCWSA